MKTDRSTTTVLLHVAQYKPTLTLNHIRETYLTITHNAQHKPEIQLYFQVFYRHVLAAAWLSSQTNPLPVNLLHALGGVTEVRTSERVVQQSHR